MQTVDERAILPSTDQPSAFIAIYSRHTRKLLFRYCPYTHELEIAERGIAEVIDLKQYQRDGEIREANSVAESPFAGFTK